MYCSEECYVSDWNEQHKHACETLLIAGERKRGPGSVSSDRPQKRGRVESVLKVATDTYLKKRIWNNASEQGLCTGINEEYIEEKLESKSTEVIYLSDRSYGLKVKAILIYTKQGKKRYHLDLLCANRGFGVPIFEYFKNIRTPREIQIEAVPAAIGFWRSRGFLIGDRYPEDPDFAYLIDTFTKRNSLHARYLKQRYGAEGYESIVNRIFSRKILKKSMAQLLSSEQQAIRYKMMRFNVIETDGVVMKWRPAEENEKLDPWYFIINPETGESFDPLY